jgi:ABC-type multidrug transport system fused ATPase/permease subunit
MEKWKWLSRAAGLLIVLGFFMPAVLVSCNAGFVEQSQSISFADIASNFDTPILYLVPILAIAVIILSLLQNDNSPHALSFLWGQLAAILLALLTLLVTLISIMSKVGQSSYGVIKVTPTLGLSLSLVRWSCFSLPGSTEKPLRVRHACSRFSGCICRRLTHNVLPPPIIPQYTPQGEAPGQQHIQPYLTAVSGNLPFKNVQIGFDNFTIGRATTNHLHLQDISVSRIHAIFRNSQKSWFLQDQESSGGTYVNGSRTDAVRLNEGDEIAIVHTDSDFIFLNNKKRFYGDGLWRPWQAKHF